MKTLYIVLMATLAVSLSTVGSAYAIPNAYDLFSVSVRLANSAMDMKLDVFDYTQRALTPSEIGLLAQSGLGDYRGFDLLVMDSRIEFKEYVYDVNDDSTRVFAGLFVLNGDDYVAYYPSNDVSTINVSCPSEFPDVIPKDVPTGVFLCYLVPSGSVPFSIHFGEFAQWYNGNRIIHMHSVLFAPDSSVDWDHKASYTLNLIQDVHIPILQSTIYFDDLEQLFLVFDRSVRVNDIGFASLYFGANSTYTFERADVIGSSSGQVLRLNATSHNLSYTDAALVLQQDAFISTVDENNVYNSEAILPIIRVR